MPFVDFSTSGQDTQGQLKVFSAVLLALWFCTSTSTLLQEGPVRLCFSCGLLRKLHLLPKAVLSRQRLGTSLTRERMGATLRLETRQHPPDAGPDVHPRGFSCYGVPLRAWDGHPPLRGEAFPQATGPDLSSGHGADWDTERQANVFSPNTVSTLVRLHVTLGYSC